MFWKSIVASSVLILALAPVPAQSKLTKYWVLKTGGNSGVPQYQAYTSQKACERQRRRMLSFYQSMKRKGFDMGGYAKCMNHLPYGYQIVR